MKNQIKQMTAIVAILILATSCQKEQMPTNMPLKIKPLVENEISNKIEREANSTIQKAGSVKSIQIQELLDQMDETEIVIQEILEAKKQSGEIMEEFYELETRVQVAMSIVKLRELGFQVETIPHEDLEHLVVEALESFEVNFEYFNTPLQHVKNYVNKTRDLITLGLLEEEVPEEVRDNIILLGREYVERRGEAFAKVKLYLFNEGESIEEESKSVPFYIDVLTSLQANF